MDVSLEGLAQKIDEMEAKLVQLESLLAQEQAEREGLGEYAGRLEAHIERLDHAIDVFSEYREQH